MIAVGRRVEAHSETPAHASAPQSGAVKLMEELMNTRFAFGRTVALIALAAVGTATLQSAASSGLNGPTLKPLVATTSGGMPLSAQTLWAVIDETGTNIRSLPKTTTKSSHLGTGNYEVDFYENVDACSYQATVGPAGSGSSQGYVTVAARAGNAKGVFVATFNTSGAPADLPFHLAIHC